tara:strand:- start:13 stop:174 length:162 start_codon:yes stop_codon:yes gene_type:complete
MERESEENLIERLAFLEELLSEVCGNAYISLALFSTKIECGWEQYQAKFNVPP